MYICKINNIKKNRTKPKVIGFMLFGFSKYTDKISIILKRAFYTYSRR